MSDATKKKKVVAIKEAQYEVGFLYSAPPGLPSTDNSVENKIINPVDKTSEGDKKSYRHALDEQKFTQYPFLANAPLEGAYVAVQDHTINPVGVVLRNVKCAKCGMYGHRSNEKACPMLGVMTEAEKWHARVEDPLTAIKGVEAEGEEEKQRFALRTVEDAVIGGLKKDDPNLQLVQSDESGGESGSEAEDMHKTFLASLSKSQMRTLLKEYKREAKKKKKKAKNKHKKHKSKDSDSEKAHKRHKS